MTYILDDDKTEITTRLPPSLGKAVQLKMSKDGTNYEIQAIELPEGIINGYMCHTDPSILIISGYDKTAYAFSKKSHISWDYVQEKLTPKGSRKDAQNLTILIQKAQQILNGDNP